VPNLRVACPKLRGYIINTVPECHAIKISPCVCLSVSNRSPECCGWEQLTCVTFILTILLDLNVCHIMGMAYSLESVQDIMCGPSPNALHQKHYTQSWLLARAILDSCRHSEGGCSKSSRGPLVQRAVGTALTLNNEGAEAEASKATLHTCMLRRGECTLACIAR